MIGQPKKRSLLAMVLLFVLLAATLLSFSFLGTDEDDQIFQLDGSYPFGYYIPTSETRVTLKFASDGSFNYSGVNLTYFLEDTTSGK